MKVSGVRTTVVDVPLAHPAANATNQIGSISCVLVMLDTDEGITGEHLLWTQNRRRIGVLDEMVRSLANVVEGQDPEYTERVWRACFDAANFIGTEGVTIAGIAAIDGALWDIKGKRANRPIHQLLGGARTEIPAYHSGGLWTTQGPKELEADARRFLESGFKAMKMRIGRSSPAVDVERVRALRAAVGPDVALMADANRSMSVSDAIRLGRKLEEFDLAWFEEPVAAHDLTGCAEVAAALDMPIASGETEYTRFGFREMLDAKAADVWMADFQRVGGVTDFLKVGHLADAYNIPISSHFYSETSLQLLGTLANATYLEYMDWLAPLYREAIEFRDGNALIPTRPGWGFTFDPAAVARFKV